MRRKLIALLAAIAVVVVACGGEDASQVSGERPSSSATLRILQPQPGDVTGTELALEMQLDGGRVVDVTTTDLRPDEGHIHVHLNGQIITKVYGLQQTITVEPGTHLLEAEFVAADHIPFNPRVITSTTFTAQ